MKGFLIVKVSLCPFLDGQQTLHHAIYIFCKLSACFKDLSGVPWTLSAMEFVGSLGIHELTDDMIHMHNLLQTQLLECRSIFN